MPAMRYESNCTRVCRAGMVVRGGGVLRTTSVLHLLYQSSNSPPLPFVTFSSLTLPNLVNLNFRVTINTLTPFAYTLCLRSLYVIQTHTHAHEPIIIDINKKKNYRL